MMHCIHTGTRERERPCGEKSSGIYFNASATPANNNQWTIYVQSSEKNERDYKNRPPSNLRLNLVVMKWAPCNVTEEAGPVLGTHLMTPPRLQSIGPGVGSPLGMKHYCELQEPINILPTNA